MAALQKPIVLSTLATILGTRKDVGAVCTSGSINDNSVYKPYQHSSASQSLSNRQAAKYGWSILSKTAGATTLSFLNSIYSKGDQAKCWTHLKPRGISYNEWYRLLDFDGYDSSMKPYGEPISYNRLSSYELAISGTHSDTTILKHQGKIIDYTSETFNLTGAFEGIIKFQLVEPIPGPFIHWYVDGVVDVYLEDANNREVHHWNDIFFVQGTGEPNELVMNLNFMDSLEGFTGPFHLKYHVNIGENETYYKQDSIPGAEEEYLDVVFRINTEYVASLREDYRGTKGVYIKTSRIPEAWTNTSPSAESVIFGQNTFNICVIQVSNGSTVQRKIVYAGMMYIPFKKIGITIEPRANTSDDDVIVYMLKGSQSIFPSLYAGVLWGDISLADNYSLQTFPLSMKKLGKMPAPPLPVVIYSDDCQGIWVWINGRTEPYAYDEPKQGGLTPAIPGDEYECNRIRVKWNIGIDNYPTYGTLTAHLATYDGEGDNVLYDEKTQSFSVSPSSGQTIYIDLTANCIPYTMNSVWIKLWFDLDGVRYYVNMFPQRLQDNNPGQWNIGTGEIYND